MGLQKLMDWIIGIFQIGQLARACRTGFAARRRESFRNPVVAEIAFVRGIRLRIQEPAAVGARLNAVTAAQTIFLVYQDDSIWADKRRAHWTHLSARRIGAVIAHFGDEERFPFIV